MFLTLCFQSGYDFVQDLDELQGNDVDINMRTLAHYVNYLRKRHATINNEIKNRVSSDDIPKILDVMNVNNFGRAMAYLTLVYLMTDSEDETRRAVRLVVVPLIGFDINAFRIEENCFRRIIKRMFGL
jgi:hypothetical protein